MGSEFSVVLLEDADGDFGSGSRSNCCNLLATISAVVVWSATVVEQTAPTSNAKKKSGTSLALAAVGLFVRDKSMVETEDVLLCGKSRSHVS